MEQRFSGPVSHQMPVTSNNIHAISPRDGSTSSRTSPTRDTSRWAALSEHFEAEIKKTWHFAMNIFKCIFLIRSLDFHILIKISLNLLGFNWHWQWDSISSGNGPTLKRGQAITWTNPDPGSWCCRAPLGHNVSTFYALNSSEGTLECICSFYRFYDDIGC